MGLAAADARNAESNLMINTRNLMINRASPGGDARALDSVGSTW